MFEGFSPETVDFLWGIRMNNNREWFMENKKNYTQYLYEPMKELENSCMNHIWMCPMCR